MPKLINEPVEIPIPRNVIINELAISSSCLSTKLLAKKKKRFNINIKYINYLQHLTIVNSNYTY